MAPKPAPARVKFRLDGPVPAAAEILASDRLSEFSGTLIDPNSSKGTVSAAVTLGLPIKRELTKADTTYSITADLNGFAADKLVMNQKLEANALKVTANNQGYQVKGDVKINGQAASLDYRKPNEGDADIKLQATLDDASRARLGFDLGPAVSGAHSDQADRARSATTTAASGIDADLTALKLDNILPGWVKLPGKSSRAVFNVVQKPQSTRFEDIVIDGGGVSIKGSLEVDQNGDLINANFPIYSPSDGDKTTLKAERGSDGVIKVTMRGDVFDGRGFLKSAISGKEADAKSKAKSIDFDVDLKLGAVAGFNGEAVRSVDVKLSRRNGVIRNFTLSGKLGRDTPLTADLRGRPPGPRSDLSGDQRRRRVFALHRHLRQDGRRPASAGDGSADRRAQRERGADQRPRFRGQGRGCARSRRGRRIGRGAERRRVLADARGIHPAERAAHDPRRRVERADDRRDHRGQHRYSGNQVRMSGTFVPMYGLNNMFGQIPIVGLFLGGGSNEGLIGVTYEVVGTPGQPVLRVNPISAMAPGVLQQDLRVRHRQAEQPDRVSAEQLMAVVRRLPPQRRHHQERDQSRARH